MTMDRYRVELLPAARKDLDKLQQWKARIFEKLLELETNPTTGELLSGNLKGTRSLKFNLPGSGAYRIAYVVSGPACIVYYIGTRENAYAEIARRARQVL